jgi:hypothetical protein
VRGSLGEPTPPAGEGETIMKRLMTLAGGMLAAGVLLAGAGCSFDVKDAFDKAKEHDDRKRYEKTVWCPECGSSEKRKTDIGKVGTVFGSGMVFKCKKCGHKYQ